MKTKTSVKLSDGCAVFLIDAACAKCGCFEAFAFDCNCGAVHSDVCYHCGGFVDYPHKAIEEENAKYPQLDPGLRCHAGRIEHEHKAYTQADVADRWTTPPEAMS